MTTQRAQPSEAVEIKHGDPRADLPTEKELYENRPPWVPQPLDYDLHFPTEKDLPSDGGEPMETEFHVLQMFLLREVLVRILTGRSAYVGADMAIYYSATQARNQDFRAPDIFAVLGVDPRMRESWVVWIEGRGPDLVIEVVSVTSETTDRVTKKAIYQTNLRVPEYFLYDPATREVEGYRLVGNEYESITPDTDGRLESRVIGGAFRLWDGEYCGRTDCWLRCETADGVLVPTGDEVVQYERTRADAAQAQADAAQAQARAERERAEAALRRVSELEAQLAAQQGE